MTIRRLRSLGVLVLLAGCWNTVAAGPASPPAAAPWPVTLDDREQIKSPNHPTFSRDERQIAYVLDDQIYVVPTAGGVPRAVTSAGTSAWDPHWSKDGRALYFLSDRSGTAQ